MAFIIRKAAISDGSQMAKVHTRSWEAAYADIIPNDTISEKNAGRPSLWNKLLTEADGNFKFAVCDNEDIVGLIMLGESKDEDAKKNTLEVGCLYLLPEYFGKDFGRLAMEFAFHFAIENAYSKITLWVLEENQRARRFYEKCGYVFDETKKEVFIGKPLIELRYAITLL